MRSAVNEAHSGTGENANWIQRDLAHVWHPCMQMKDFEIQPMIPVKSGKGVWLEDFEGQRYLDGISSWWVNIFGHANPQINDALKNQLDNLAHCMTANFTHGPMVELSEQLVGLTPGPLQKVFFADNGSSAIEVALKMSFHYWRNVGKPKKTRFVALKNSYHGETLGALAVGDVELYKETYDPLLFKPILAPSPDCYYREAGESWEAYSKRQAVKMDELLAKHADEVAAVIIEPLVQCAGYMRMYHPVYLKRLRESCDRHGVHFIADEIAVGFGRTGSLFACEQADNSAGVSPDFMLLSKGLTAGYMPLAVCLTTEHIYQAFYDDYNTLKAFLHSHSYTGNALGCATALATLKIFAEQPVIARNHELAAHMQQATEHLADHPHVAEVRQTGMVLAIEMVQNKASRPADSTPYPWQERRGVPVYQHALSQGVFMRPLAHVVYFMPPYVINEQEIDLMARVATEGIDIATNQ